MAWRQSDISAECYCCYAERSFSQMPCYKGEPCGPGRCCFLAAELVGRCFGGDICATCGSDQLLVVLWSEPGLDGLLPYESFSLPDGLWGSARDRRECLLVNRWLRSIDYKTRWRRSGMCGSEEAWAWWICYRGRSQLGCLRSTSRSCAIRISVILQHLGLHRREQQG